MRNAHLGALEVSRIGLGAMTMAGTYTSGGALDDAESIATIHRALDLGVTHVDTAEVYGPYHSEELVGRAIAGRRDAVVVATKFGLVSHADGRVGTPDSSPANIATAVEGSLRRLGTDHIDLYYQHRVDPNTPIEDTIGALAELVAEARSATSACPRPGSTPSAAPTPSTPSPRCSRSTRCGPATGTRGAAPAPRAGHRVRALLPARPRLPDRHHPLGERLRPGRLPGDQPPLHRRELPAQPRHRRPGPGDRRRGRRHPRPGRAGLAADQGRRHRPHPGNQAGVTPGRERRRRRRRAHRRADREA